MATPTLHVVERRGQGAGCLTAKRCGTGPHCPPFMPFTKAATEAGADHDDRVPKGWPSAVTAFATSAVFRSTVAVAAIFRPRLSSPV